LDTLTFLEKILPEAGTYYLVIIDKTAPEGRNVAHKAYDSLTAMTQAAHRFDKHPNLQVYHACAAYKDSSVEVKGKRKYRTASNQLSAKAFWVDMDCGEEKHALGKGYLTQMDASRAITGFARLNGLPDPMIVGSGYGVHAYWPLTEAIKPSRWVAIAQGLKAMLAHQEILVDAGITADFARILRPVGTSNKKRDGKMVRVVRDAAPIDVANFEATIAEYVSDFGLIVEDNKDYDKSLNSDLTAHLKTYADVPTWADTVANHCQQVALMRDTQGDVSYDHWVGVIGIIKHCQEGLPLAEEWSARREETGHSQNNVVAKYESLEHGPTKCSTFEAINPEGCEGCPHKGKQTSPIKLGQRIVEPEPVVVEVIKDEAVIVEEYQMPDGYLVGDSGMLFRQVKDKEGEVTTHVFSSTLFYPTARIKREDGKYWMAVRAHMPREGIKDFDISQSVIFSPTDLQRSLADYQIMTTHNKDAPTHLTAYMKDWLEKLKRETDEQNTYQTFGWKHDKKRFLLADRMYHEDGTVREVLVSSNAKTKLSDFPTPTGNYQDWAGAIDFMYGAENNEYRQYALASGFGSVLTAKSSDPLYRGLVFAIVGGDTAKGKTTLSRAALSIFGDPNAMSIKTDKGATVNARYARMGMYCNLPVLFDEMTNIDPDDLSAFCYTVSLGEEKERLAVPKGGTMQFAPTNTWAFSPFVTANADLHAILAAKSGNSQAEAVRLVQVKVDEHAMTQISSSEFNLAVRTLERCQGTAGDKFLRYVVAHPAVVEEKMLAWAKRIEQAIPDTKYRFYRGHVECSMAGLEIARELGLVTFDVEQVYEYAVRLFTDMAENVKTQNTVDIEDALSAVITSLSDKIIVSTEYRTNKEGNAEFARDIKDAVGRYIIGSKNEKILAGRLYLQSDAIRKWCAGNRVEYKKLMATARAMGVLIDIEENRIMLGRGTTVTAGQVRCICIDMRKLESIYGEGTMPLAGVSHLHAVKES
jgi:hypothetical protein